MKKSVLGIIVAGLAIVILVLFIYKGSYALDESIVKKDLLLEYHQDSLENDFYNYIDMIDDSLIPTTSFNMSNVLSNNYDFLTVFAINYILNNIDDYKDDIITGDDYTYNNGIITYGTNKYVKKDVIYEITDKVFGKKEYLIINNYLPSSDDMIPLLLINDYSFDMEIDKIQDILVNGNTYTVMVKYKDNDFVYKYIFKKENDRLILNNLEV